VGEACLILLADTCT